MDDANRYILDSIKHWVWSGFYSEDEVQERIDDILEEEDEADEDLVRGSVAREFAAKAAAEATWPDQTDCDRLDGAFTTLNNAGIIALANAGYTMSDGIGDVGEELHKRGHANVQGYCFYHEQDVERAIDGDGLTLAFGDLDDDKAQKVAVGKLVSQILTNAGFKVDWNGDSETRLRIPHFDWKRRYVS